MSGLEQQIVQGVTGLLALAVSAAVAYVSPRAKRWIGAHTTAQTATMAMTVINGLGNIAEAVVEDFDQRVVIDAKAQGTWTPALAASVKADAVRAVMDQGSQLALLGQSVVGNVPALVSTLIEQAVRWRKVVPKGADLMATATATATSTQTTAQSTVPATATATVA